jgi:hypothetical protein
MVMSYRIEVTENRIEGWCDLPGWRYEQSVITFSTIHGVWHTGSSMCLPSDIGLARKVQECVAAAFEALEEIEKPPRATKGV